VATLPHGAINWLKAMYALSERAAFGPPLLRRSGGIKARAAESHRHVGRCHANQIWPAGKIGSPNLGSGCGGSLPRPESIFSEDAESPTGCEMALDVESVLDDGVNRREALG
jgi:hypothetical protein